jgi:hypothetical protein
MARFLLYLRENLSGFTVVVHVMNRYQTYQNVWEAFKNERIDAKPHISTS